MIVNIENNIKYDLREREISEDLKEYSILFNLSKNSCETLKLNFSFPFVNCAGALHPKSFFNRSIDADWDDLNPSMTAKSAPVYSLFSEDSKNRMTVALSEIKRIVKILIGVHEEDGTAICRIEIPSETINNQESYELKILIDQREIHFSKALNNVTTWWENLSSNKLMKVSDCARDFVYSSWYAFHQDLDQKEIEEECREASKLGLKTLILDDGWQTSDNNRGYAYCGDWKVEESKFPNFKEHVEEIHKLGMKYILWFSVPFVGCKAKNWSKFKNKILYYNNSLEAGILDPRYKEVREFLIETYCKFVNEYNLDGLKLDFIDNFYLKEESPKFNNQMDIENVQDALAILLKDIKDQLLLINDQILIEFRQYYIGPNMRQFGNIFRVTDCPNSAIRNRVGIADLRLLSGNTAIHSDMLMWNKEETPSLCALQIISTLFSTIQFSIRLKELSIEKQKMIKFWIDFINKNKELLQKSEFIPEEPHNLYPIIKVKKNDEMIASIYSENKGIRLEEDINSLTVVNGAKCENIIILDGNSQCSIKVKNCLGETLVEESYTLESCDKFIVPVGGMITILKK